MLTFTSCANNSAKLEGAQAAVDSFLKAMASQDYETASALSIGAEIDIPDTPEEEELNKIFFKHLNWTIINETILEDSSIVHVVVKNKDNQSAIEKAGMKSLLTQHEQNLSDDDTFKMMMEELPKEVEAAKPVSITTAVEVKKTDGKWIVQRSKKFMQALYGNSAAVEEQSAN